MNFAFVHQRYVKILCRSKFIRRVNFRDVEVNEKPLFNNGHLLIVHSKRKGPNFPRLFYNT